jgi:ribosomal-protein-alanine N-acetyltransferase
MHQTDLEAVSELDRLSFSMPWPKESFRNELANPTSLCRVAEANFTDGTKRIIGAMVTWIIVDEAHISTLAVNPAFRRRGIGRILMIDSLTICYEQGVKTVTLEVGGGDTPPPAPKQKIGFDIVAVQRGYYSDNHEDAYIMTLQNLRTSPFIQKSIIQESRKKI